MNLPAGAEGRCDDPGAVGDVEVWLPSPRAELASRAGSLTGQVMSLAFLDGYNDGCEHLLL